MRSLLDSLDCGLLWLDAQGLIQHCNAWILERCSLSQAPLGLSLAQAFGEEQIDPYLLRAVNEALRSGRPARLSHAFHPTPLPLLPRRGDRAQRLQQAVDVLACSDEGRPGCLIQVRDLTETLRREQLLKQQARQLALDLGQLQLAQDELTRNAARLRELTRLAPVALFETDLQGHLLYCNDRFLSLWGMPAVPALGRHWSALLPESAVQALSEPFTHLGQGQSKVQLDVCVTEPQGRDRWLQFEASDLRNADHQSFGYLVSLVDVTDLYRRAQHLEHRAHHDALTGLPNREKLMQRLDQALLAARNLGHVVTLIFMDLDGFKAVNDTHGHAAGDVLLQTVAQRMRRSLRSEDVVARLAGDEFALILSEAVTPEQVERAMGKVVQTIEEPVHWGGQFLQVGASWGMARFPEHGADAAGLLMAADHAMYAHKQTRKSDEAVRTGFSEL